MPEQENINKAKQIAGENLRECLLELLEHRKTGVLPDGHVRIILDLLKPVDGDDSLKLAESIINNLAIERGKDRIEQNAARKCHSS